MATSTMMNSFVCKEDQLKESAMQELLATLKTQPEFIKVHAAEFLIWLGHTEEVRKEFLKENEIHGSQPKYRIGIWRVLAQTESDPQKKKVWTDKIFAAFTDMNGEDRLHAAETLAKLKISPLESAPDITRQSLQDESRNMQVYTQWAVSYSPGANADQSRSNFIKMATGDSSHVVRLISAYILRRNKGFTTDEWKAFAAMALSEPDTSAMKRPMLNTAFVTAPEEVEAGDAYLEISTLAKSNYQQFTAGERIELAQVLAEKGDNSDIDLLTSFMENKNIQGIYEADSKEAADVRAAAAYAILKIRS